jgi:putative N6-adenine-specific DNA methylase
MTSFSLLAQCAPGLEPLLAAELRARGVTGTAIQGGVTWNGGWDTLLVANLHLRTASRVLVEVGRFRARALGELERKAGEVDWERVHAAVEGGAAASENPSPRVRFRVSASRSRLYHERAIEERLRRAADLPPDPPSPGGSETDEAGPLLVVRVHRDEVILRLDASGDHLHRRGYRTHVGIAPLRETLAAALLQARDGWGDVPGAEAAPLVDPFCGSGTLVIEAALLARRIPPGMASPGYTARDFACLHWPDRPEGLWESILARARATILPGAPAPLLGSDRDAGVIDAAASNALRAGVADDVTFSTNTLSRVPPADPTLAPGWVVTNPPYGSRLGERKRLRPLYAALGRTVKPGGPFEGWGLAWYSADPVLDQATGLNPSVRFETTNGGLRVRAVGVSPGEAATSPSR